MDDFLFMQTLTTPTGSTHISMIRSQDEDGEDAIYLNKLMDDESVLSLQIQTADANDILQALIKVNQMMHKAVVLGEVAC